jgi:predicted permease
MSLERWRYRLPLLLRSLFKRKAVERELDEELRYHFEQQLEANLAAGMSEADARRHAARAIGELDLRKEQCRDRWAVAAFDRLARDVRLACRALRHDLGFAIGVLALLTLGIGANVAVYSLVGGILVEPLPYPRPDRLAAIFEVLPETGPNRHSVNALHFAEWRNCKCFGAIALVNYREDVNFAAGGEPERLAGLGVTANFFDVLGVRAELGRTFVAGDAVAGTNVVVISDRLWRTSLGADPAAIGKAIRLDGVEWIVIGVLSPRFRHHAGGAGPDGRIDLYRPWDPAPLPWWGWNNNYSYFAVARLADGMAADAALAELNGIQAAIAREHFTGNETALTLRAELVPLHEWVTGTSRAGLLLLLAAVGAALLVACLNIANLMLVRASARTVEASVRSALGAPRFAIFRGVLIESLILAFAGTAAGIALAAAAVMTFKSFGAAALPRANEVAIDGGVLAVAIGLALLCTVTVGLVPALRMTRASPQDALRAAGRAVGDSPRSRRFRQTLVAAEVALSVGLLIAAGLLLTSFARLGSVPRGFDSTNVLTAAVGLPAVRYPDDDARIAFQRELLRDLRSRPGVAAAGITSALPLRGRNWGSTVIAEGTEPPAAERPSVDYRFVSEGYLEAMGIPVLQGRGLRADDFGVDVAVMSESTAKRVWPDGAFIGRRFHRGNPEEMFEVVGVVPDVHSEDLAKQPVPIVYTPVKTTRGFVFPLASIALRTPSDPEAAAGLLRDAVHALDPELALANVRTMTQIERASLAQRRFQLALVVVFGGATLVIAALGIYSLLAYTVASRRQEIALRIALGARSPRVRSLVLREGFRPVLAGLGLGIAGSLLLGRLLSNLLFEVTPTDPVTFATVAAVTLAAAFFAAWGPARRAARMPLLTALRYE